METRVLAATSGPTDLCIATKRGLRPLCMSGRRTDMMRAWKASHGVRWRKREQKEKGRTFDWLVSAFELQCLVGTGILPLAASSFIRLESTRRSTGLRERKTMRNRHGTPRGEDPTGARDSGLPEDDVGPLTMQLDLLTLQFDFLASRFDFLAMRAASLPWERRHRNELMTRTIARMAPRWCASVLIVAAARSSSATRRVEALLQSLSSSEMKPEEKPYHGPFGDCNR
jgi:hypothetical protein